MYVLMHLRLLWQERNHFGALNPEYSPKYAHVSWRRDRWLLDSDSESTWMAIMTSGLCVYFWQERSQKRLGVGFWLILH